LDYFKQYFAKELPKDKFQKINSDLDIIGERKDFLIAKDKNTSTSWNEFRNKHPNNPLDNSIKQLSDKLKEKEDLQVAISSNNADKFNEFLIEHPSFPYRETIERGIQQNDFSIIHTLPSHLTPPVTEFHIPPVVEEEGLFLRILEHIRF
jgi:hypothetical protein